MPARRDPSSTARPPRRSPPTAPPLAWDRSVTDNVDAEVELGVVVGAGGSVFGYTVINDVSSRDEQLDGDQWLLGKSMPGFCPVGPVVVTADELDPADLRLECLIDGEPIQDGTTAAMRFGIPEVLAFLGRHLELRPGRPDRDRHAAPPGDASRAGSTAPRRRHRDLPDRGHRGARRRPSPDRANVYIPPLVSVVGRG